MVLNGGGGGQLVRSAEEYGARVIQVLPNREDRVDIGIIPDSVIEKVRSHSHGV